MRNHIQERASQNKCKELSKWVSCAPGAQVKQTPQVNAGNSLGVAVPRAPHFLNKQQQQNPTLTFDSVTDHNLHALWKFVISEL